jgi:hypothetical protein
VEFGYRVVQRVSMQLKLTSGLALIPLILLKDRRDKLPSELPYCLVKRNPGLMHLDDEHS